MENVFFQLLTLWQQSLHHLVMACVLVKFQIDNVFVFVAFNQCSCASTVLKYASSGIQPKGTTMTLKVISCTVLKLLLSRARCIFSKSLLYFPKCTWHLVKHGSTLSYAYVASPADMKSGLRNVDTKRARILGWGLIYDTEVASFIRPNLNKVQAWTFVIDLFQT